MNEKSYGKDLFSLKKDWRTMQYGSIIILCMSKAE